jgi:dephospho-CoA kinase
MVFNKDIKIVAFVGLTGSGKSAAADYIVEKGYPKVYFGGIIYAAMNEAGIEITPDSQQQFREEIRAREGKDFVVKRVIKQTNDLIAAGQHRIILDGLYSWTEYKILKHEFPGELSVIAIVAPKKLRHHRLSVRTERPFTNEEANTRDWTEIENLEKGGPIAIADHYIINDGDLDNLYKQIDDTLNDIGFYKS